MCSHGPQTPKSTLTPGLEHLLYALLGTTRHPFGPWHANRHPDKNSAEDREECTARIQVINAAYTRLTKVSSMPYQ